MAKKGKKTRAEILSDLKTRPTMALWPTYGIVFDVCRGRAYAAAAQGLADGDPTFLREGKLIKLVTAPLRKKLGIEGAA